MVSLVTAAEDGFYRVVLDYALSFLSKSPKTAGEVVRALRKKFPTISEILLASVMERLVELRLVDDVRYARRCFDFLVLQKKKSFSEVRRKLRFRGISDDIIEQIIPSGEELRRTTFSTIRKIARKKLRGFDKYGDSEKKRKLFMYLLRKGFCYDDVYKVLNEGDVT